MSVTKEKIEFLTVLKKENPAKYEKELKKLDRELFDKYCLKKDYKDKCDPICASAFTNTCKYLHEMRKLWDEFGYSH